MKVFEKSLLILFVLVIVCLLLATTKPVGAHSSCADLSMAMATNASRSRAVMSQITSSEKGYVRGNYTRAQFIADENARFAKYLGYRVAMLDAQIAWNKTCSTHKR